MDAFKPKYFKCSFISITVLVSAKLYAERRKTYTPKIEIAFVSECLRIYKYMHLHKYDTHHDKKKNMLKS